MPGSVCMQDGPQGPITAFPLSFFPSDYKSGPDDVIHIFQMNHRMSMLACGECALSFSNCAGDTRERIDVCNKAARAIAVCHALDGPVLPGAGAPLCAVEDLIIAGIFASWHMIGMSLKCEHATGRMPLKTLSTYAHVLMLTCQNEISYALGTDGSNSHSTCTLELQVYNAPRPPQDTLQCIMSTR